MIKKISIIGGDLRIVKLMEMMEKDGFEISTYALEKSDIIQETQNIKIAKDLKEVVDFSDIIISSVPFSSNGTTINTPFSQEKVTLEELINIIQNKTFIAGNIPKEFFELGESKNNKMIDLLKQEEMLVLNSIATAEGTIQIAMEETLRTLHGSNILIMGYGRIGKVLAKMLKGIGANVYCEARRESDLSWIKVYGYNMINFKDLDKNLDNFHVIINTIPTIILDKERLKKVKKDCLLIDLASNPGGIDKKAAKEYGLKLIWALSIPGKVAPISTAEFMRDTIYHNL